MTVTSSVLDRWNRLLKCPCSINLILSLAILLRIDLIFGSF